MVKNIIILVLLTIIIFMVSCGVNFSREEIEKKNISGKVIAKYNDERNHGAPTIIYFSGDVEQKLHIIDWTKKSNLWEYLQINDSISKPSGILTLRVIKPDGVYNDYEYRK